MKSQTPKWEQFAQEDPEVYIWGKARTSADYQDTFFATGRNEVPGILSLVEPYLRGRDLVVEYGCGVGRLLIPMREHFDAALGVDISPSMLGRLRDNCAERGVTGVRTALATDDWPKDVRADLVYCWAVFQHIASAAVIQGVLNNIARAVKPGTGVAFLHFDTRRRTPAYWARFALPDALLPRFWRKSIRCIRRRPERVRKMLARAGFEIVNEMATAPAYRVFVVQVPLF